MAQSSDPCKTQSNTIEINECASLTLKAKDRELNQAYRSLLDALKQEAKEGDADLVEARRRLMEAQRSWIMFRDNDCEGKYSFWEGGTIRGAMYLGCMIERTEQRTKELRSWTRP
jgi:uncharacterized protein YecT (DUF1311 family)